MAAREKAIGGENKHHRSMAYESISGNGVTCGAASAAACRLNMPSSLPLARAIYRLPQHIFDIVVTEYTVSGVAIMA